MTCPSDGEVLPSLYAVARKAARIGCGGERFREWNYRLLLDGADEYRYGDAYFVLYDKLHTQADRAFVEAFHRSLLARGFVHGFGGANEGPGVRYYATAAERDRRAPCAFSVISDKGTLLLQLRLRAPDACADYLAGCPETVKAMFRTSDPGCGNAAAAAASAMCSRGRKSGSAAAAGRRSSSPRGSTTSRIISVWSSWAKIGSACAGKNGCARSIRQDSAAAAMR